MRLFGIVLTILLNITTALAWDFIPSDNSTQLDMYNFLLCLTHVGFGNDTNVYKPIGTHYVTLNINGPNASELITNAGRCNRGFTDNLTFSIHEGPLDPERMSLVGTISEMLDSYLEMPDWSRGYRLVPLTPIEYQKVQITRRNERIRLGLDVFKS